MIAIAELLNNDTDIAYREFVVRKKPYGRSKPSWEPGGFVCPDRVMRKPHENSRNIVEFGILIAIVDPTDAVLTGVTTHLGDIERIENIFQGQSHADIPGTLLAVQDSNFRIELTTVTSGNRIIGGAFEAGFDASSCVVNVLTTMNRYNSGSL